MKKLAVLSTAAALCIFTSCEPTKKEMPYNQGIHIIPAPVSLVQNTGAFNLRQSTVFFAPTAEAKTIANFFASQIGKSTGYPLAVTQEPPSSGAISLLLDETLNVNDEGYTLESAPEGITIQAKTPQGLFYGMQTFMQLLPAEIENQTVVEAMTWDIPSVSITDQPTFAYRGMMLDVCRHFMPVETIKKQLDVLALFKINKFHWHLTDDQAWRIEIKKYPKLTQLGSVRTEGDGKEYGNYFFTQEQIREVVAYAAQRFIEVIPEIELPGHALGAIVAYPDLCCTGNKNLKVRNIWGVEDDVFCAGKEETFQFLEDVIAEVVPLFPGKYFHIGGDECPKVRWKECPLCKKRMRENNLKDTHELQSYFVQRIGKVLDGYGKKMIGWDEILEGGLAPSATVMSWRGEEGGIAAANLDHDVIMTPGGAGMYLDAYQGDPKIEPVTIGGYTLLEKTYNYNPYPEKLPAEKRHFIQGAQGNVWAEYMYTPELMEYRAYPRILAVAELTWTPYEKKDYKDFERRLDNALVRLDAHNINYHIPQPEQPGGSCNFVAFTDTTSLTFKTTRPVKMVYTTDGTQPTPQSTVYTAPISFANAAVLNIRSVLSSGKMSKTRTITIDKQSLSPAQQVQDMQPGLMMKVTYGSFQTAEDLKNVQEWKELPIKGLRELVVERIGSSLGNVKPFAAIATGYIHIPEDGVYYFSTDNEELWIDGKRLISNANETKRYSRNDSSAALAKGWHPIKVVFIGQVCGGWPTYWNDASVKMRPANGKFTPVTPQMLAY